MVEIFPFKGYRYSLNNKEIAKAVSQPYDIISDDKLKELLKYPYNIANIIKNRNHKEAKRLLEDWIQKGILKKEDKESIYIYRQEFSYDNKTYKRTGMIVLARVYDYEEKQILPHENIREETVIDRLDLLKETKANVGLIFTYCNNNISSILENLTLNKTIYNFKDKAGIPHSLWKSDDKDIISNIKKIFESKRLYILDGHHRYEASRRFKDEYDKFMVYIVCNKNSLLILDHNKITDESDKKFPKSDITLEYVIGKANNLETIGKKTTYFYPKPLSGLVVNKF